MGKIMSKLDGDAWLFCHGKIFHPDYDPQRILEECNEQFPGHTISLESIQKLYDHHQKALRERVEK